MIEHVCHFKASNASHPSRSESKCHVVRALASSNTPLHRPPLPSDFKQRVTRQFDLRADRYDVGNTYHPPLAEGVVTLAGLQEGESVLDVGAGTGLVALAAAEEVGPEGSVTAVDLSAAMLRKAELKAEAEWLDNLTFLVADIDACTFPAGAFDAVLCSSVLPFLPDIPASLARWRTWIKPTGRVVFNVPKGTGSQAYTSFAALAAERGLLLPDPCCAFADERQVEQLLQAAGYSDCLVAYSAETNLRAGQTPQDWAAAGWEQCVNMPFADLPALLTAEELEAMRQEYLVAAARLAEGFATPEGIAEPYTMLWVVGWNEPLRLYDKAAL